MVITNEQMIKLLGANKQDLINKLLPNLNVSLNKWEINTNLRVSHFLAQILHESAGFLYIKENLNYSADGLLKIFPKYFTEESAKLYARNPSKIANKIYGNRMGNGNESTGDGYKFCGRTYIQLTGKDNYTLISKDLGVDFVSKPELLETEKYAIEVSCWFWNKNKLNQFADLDDVMTITKKINGSTIGLLDRKQWLTKCKTVFV